MSRLHISDITLPLMVLLLEKLVSSSFLLVLSSSFHLFQLFSNFFKYSFSKFLLSHLYNIFAVYLSSNSSLLKFFSSTKSNFFHLLTSTFILLSSSTTNSFAFSKYSFFFQLSCSAVNPFHHTKCCGNY